MTKDYLITPGSYTFNQIKEMTGITVDYHQKNIAHCEGGPSYCPMCLQEFEQEVMTVDELKERWNSEADHMNQWDELGLDEIVFYAQTAHRQAK